MADEARVSKYEGWWMVNARICETARPAFVFFFCDSETFWIFRLQDRDFKAFWVRARDIQTLKIRAPDFVESCENELESCELVQFCSFLWNSDNLREVIVFFSEMESCFNELQYQVTRKRHWKENKKTNRDLDP